MIMMREWGLKNSRGNESYLLKSHIHEIPIISKELFDTCQKVREGWHRKPFKWGGKEFLFRGLIKCAITGKVVTAFTKKKTYANGDTSEWTYLRSYDPKNPTKYLYSV